MRNLVLEDDPILRKRCRPFDFENPQEDPEKLKDELLEAMVKYEGAGISACQIGVDLKVFAMRFNGEGIVCFNPRITQYTPETTYIKEGCLSFPGLFLKVQRPKEVVTQFTDSNGQTQVMTFTDIMARCFCHELEHLDGVLYTDKVAKLTLQMAQKKQRQLLKKLKRKAKRG